MDAPRPGGGDDVREERRRDALAPVGRSGAHRLDLGVRNVELPDRAAPHDRAGPVSDRPEGDAGGAERLDVERVLALGRRDRPHVGEVLLEHRGDVGRGRVLDADVHARRLHYARGRENFFSSSVTGRAMRS